jgi:hypothetical protein
MLKIFDMKKYFSILTLLCLCACTGSTLREDHSFAYAEEEAALWTSELQKITPLQGKALTIKYKCDPSMDELGQFGYRFDKGHTLTLTSSDAVGALHALYTFCEQLGITFDITGPVLPASVDWSRVEGTDTIVTPHIRWRGIRQHVNFSMDISAYTIPEVREYLQNMVRMRFNKLTIHSYPYQWYAEDVTGEMHYAGSFFYGSTHRCDKWDFLKQLCKGTNDSIFCIPGAEAVWNDKAKRSEFAMDWMRQVITTAKEMGLRVQFSCENRHFNVEQTKKLAYILTDNYPIDDLEFITEEMGGWNDDMPYATQQIDTAAATIKALEADPAFQGRVKQLKLGIYCVLHHRIGDLFRHARQILPEHYIAVLSQYASRGVASAYPKFITNAEELKWTELYSWVEFDGQMYIQQNHVEGIDDLIRQMDQTAPGVQHRSLLFNHWRTAENRTSFRYAAEATLMKDRRPDDFYREYAQRLGIEDTEAFLDMQHAMQELHAFDVDHHGNIGFAAIDFWLDEGQHTAYNPDDVQWSSDRFLKVGEMLTTLYDNAKTEAAREYLSLLGNRVLCSKLYLDCIHDGLELKQIPHKKNNPVPPAYKKKASQICEKCIAGYERMLRILAQQMPDRGCLGIIVSIWNGPVWGMMTQNHKLTGAPLDAPASSEVSLDAPPLPTFAK